MPARVHAVIASRLAQLSEPTRQLIGAAAVIGRPFTATFLSAVASAAEETVAASLDELWERRILHADVTGVWDFTHGNLRDVAYEEVGPARRQLLHRRAAEALERTTSPDTASLQIAGHFERAAQPERAMPWYERAAVAARHRYADEEAITLLTKALLLLERQPQTPQRDRTELGLLSVLGTAYSAIRGYGSPDVGRISTRARLLCELTGEVEHSFPVLASSWGFHAVRGEFAEAREIALHYQACAERSQDHLRLLAGKFTEAASICLQGALRPAADVFSAVVARRTAPGFRPFYELGPELTVFAGGYLGHMLWLLGDAAGSLIQSEKTIRFAADLPHPFSLALALAYSAMLHQFLDEPDAAESRAEEAAAICRKHNYQYYLSWTPIIRGWARARKGFTSGIDEMRDGYEALRATGAQIRAPYYLGLLAESLGEAGRFDEASPLLEEAFLIGERHREIWIKPELERIKGNLLLATGDPREAAEHHREALRLAREQGSAAFELRARNSIRH
jgi:predicted ATPase